MGALPGGTGDQVLATFGPSTAWCGKAMTFSDGVFVLEGCGLVRAADVLTYDRQDHLIWAYDGLREWVGTLAPPAVGVAQAGPEAQATPVAQTAAATAAAPEDATARAGDAQPAAEIQPAGDLWRARCLDFDARVLGFAAAAGEDLDETLLARAARCVCWDVDPAAAPDERTRAASLFDHAGAELRTLWADPSASLAPQAPAPTPAAWRLLDAPWAAIAAPPGFVGGAPETEGPGALAAMQARGPDWAAWAEEWFTPMTGLYASSRGQLAALLFAVDLGAASLDDAGYCALIRQELDARHRGITLEWRTDDLAGRMGTHGSAVESVAYGTLAGRPASRIVAESPAGFPHGPRRVHIVQYVFMVPPSTYTLSFTLPSAAPEGLGQADRIAATFAFKG